MKVTLDAASLRHADPVALLLGLLGEVPTLRHQLAVLATILSELYCNALEHGVLGLDSRCKRDAEGFERYLIAREERLAKLQHGWVRIALSCSYRRQGGAATIRVEDSGTGCDHTLRNVAAPDYAQPDELASSPALHGRGLTLIRALGARLYAGEGGRGVCALYRWNGQDQASR